MAEMTSSKSGRDTFRCKAFHNIRYFKRAFLILLGVGVLVCIGLDSRMRHTEELSFKHQLAECQSKYAELVQKLPPDQRPCVDAFKEQFQRDRKYICTNSNGGLGNFMFSFASVYGMAKMNNKVVLINRENILSKYFHLKAQVVDNLCICENATKIHESHHCAFDEKMMKLTEHSNYSPGFYFQSWKYFSHVVDDIREQFTFREDLQTKARSVIQGKIEEFEKRNPPDKNATEKSRTAPVTVGVHVRRGDISRVEQFIKFGYLLPSAQFLAKAMDYFRKKYIDPLFLFCSDDMAWTKNNVNGSDVIYVEGNSFDVDFAVLSNCNHSIMTVGTFGWWASFLAAGETVYFKHPARDGSELRKQFSANMTDYFYPGWIGMD